MFQANRGFDSEEVAEYKDVFEYFDVARKGYITSKQVATTLRALNPIPDDDLINMKVCYHLLFTRSHYPRCLLSKHV